MRHRVGQIGKCKVAARRKAPLALRTPALIAAAVMALAGCVRPSTHDKDVEAATRNDQGAASFFLAEVNGSVQDAEPILHWGVPTARLFTFKTCASDRRGGDPLKGHSFKIRTFSGAVEKTTADAHGCFGWNEKIPVNVLADAKGIRLTREIQGDGIYTGFRRKELVVFPWICGSCARQAVVDLEYGLKNGTTYEAVPQQQLVSEAETANALAGKTSNGPVQRPLWFDPAIFRNIPSSGSIRNAKMAVTFSPRAKVRNLLGADDWIPFSNGQFRVVVDAYLNVPNPAPGSREETRLHIGHGSLETRSLVAGTYSYEMPFVWANRPEAGRVDIVLSVTPVGGPAGLQPLHSRYALPSGMPVTGVMPAGFVASSAHRGEEWFDVVAYRDRARETEELCALVPALSGCRAAENATQAQGGRPSGRQPVANHSGAPALEPFTVTNVVVTPWETPVDEDPDPLIERTVRYNVLACLQYPGESRAARDVEFAVTSPEGARLQCVQTDAQGRALSEGGRPKLGPCRTNFQGCLRFPDQLKHHFYDPEHRFHRVFRVANGEWNGRVAYFVNPWSQLDPGEWELNVPASRQAETKPPNVEPSRFLVSTYSWRTTTNGFRYFIDRFLNLTVRKEVFLHLDAQVRRNNMILGYVRSSDGPLRPGWYGVRLALQKQYYDHGPGSVGTDAPPKIAEMIALDQRIVYFDGVNFNTDFAFRIPDLRFMRIRANLLVEIALARGSMLEPGARQAKRPFPVSPERYEQMIVRGVGLDPSTFVGATVFMVEQDGGPMRDTQLLAPYVCEHQDCDPRRPPANPERLPIDGLGVPVGDLALLQGKSVRDLIADGARLMKHQEASDAEAAKLSNALPALNLDFVAINDWARFRAADPDLETRNFLFRPETAFATLLARANQTLTARAPRPSQPPAREEDFHRLIETGEMSQTFSVALCRALVRQAAYRLLGASPDAYLGAGQGETPDFAANHQKTQQYWNNCDRLARTSADGLHPWMVERKILVHDVDPRAKNTHQGYLLNFSAGADFGADHSESESDNLGVSVGAQVSAREFAGGFLSKLLPTAMRIAEGAASGILSSLGGSVGVDWGHSFSWSENRGDRYGFNSSHFVGVDILPLGLNLKRYEKCVAVRLKTPFAVALLDGFQRMTGNRRVDANLFINGALRGLMICDGELRGELSPQERAVEALKRQAAAQAGRFVPPARPSGPMEIVENFYYLSQQMQDNVQIDGHLMQNNPWMMPIRGRSTFLAFVGLLRGNTLCISQANERVDHAEGPIEQLSAAYRMQGVAPTVKGIVSVSTPGRRSVWDENPVCKQRVQRWGRSIGLFMQ